MMAALEFGRPPAFALLFLPVLVLVFARRHTRPEPDATGTIELWRRSATDAPNASARDLASVPPALWWLIVALVLGVVALADPRLHGASSGRDLTVVVDRSPSMYLVSAGQTRLERALDAARGEIERFDPGRVAWIAPPAALDVSPRGRTIPPDWLQAPRVPRDAPDFAGHDRPDTLWITDAAPRTMPRHAGFAASGGPRVPGPIGSRGAALVEWDGERLFERKAAGARCVTAEAAVPDPIQRLARAWAGARGLEFRLAAGADADRACVALELRAAGGARTKDTETGRDGWTARATATEGMPASDADGPLERWLADPAGTETLVASGQGRVCIALRSLAEPRGDPAAFAVSWARLFDARVLEPEGCVPFAERAEAGPAASRPPDPEAADDARPAGPWAAMAAIGAAAAALCAIVARGSFRTAPRAALR